MEILKRNRRATLLIAAGVALALLAVPLLLKGSHHDKDGSQGGQAQDGSVIGTPGPDASDANILQPSSPKKKPKKVPATGPSTSQLTANSGGLGATAQSGLTGHGFSLPASRHRVVLTVTSATDLPTAVGWWVPTSRGDKQGGTKYIGRSWSHTTIAYGQPDYARLLVQTGVTGAPITCTITVDGKVTDRRTTPGPYGSVVCQG